MDDRARDTSSLLTIGLTIPGTGFFVTFYEDDMSPFRLGVHMLKCYLLFTQPNTQQDVYCVHNRQRPGDLRWKSFFVKYFII
jgi:hypothetical protein